MHDAKSDPLSKLFTKLHPTKEELAKVKEAESTADPQQFIRALAELDRKYKSRSIETLGLDKKLINQNAFRPVTTERIAAYPYAVSGLIGELVEANQLACDCVVPFRFRGLDVFNGMSGPEQTQVARGVIGAIRFGANEYTVFNPGDTTGKTRVHITGQMHITFSAVIPRAGRWCLIHPSGPLWIHGHSRVVGHGNMTTSYDAKVWVDYYQVLAVGSTLLEMSGGQIHYDGTRSEDRTRNFNSDRSLPARYLFFNASRAGDELVLSLRIEVDTAANEDGLAIGVIDAFGFPANTTRDYDTFVVKAP